MSKIKVFYLNAKKGCEVKEIEDDLKVFQELIDCDTIDVTYRSVGGNKLCFIVDDEGFCKKDYIISALSKSRDDALAGNLVITGFPKDGYCTSIKDEDVVRLVGRLRVNSLGYHLLMID